MKHLISYENFKTSINESLIISNEHVMLREDYNSNLTVLKNAITNKFVCTIYYRGEQKGVVDDGYRYIEPVAIGVNKSGNTVVRAWLTKGKSRTGKIDRSLVPGWRLFRLDRISSISTSLQTFTVARKGYNARDKHMTEVMFSAKF
jgi:predicted DNA-binding transcriptional regulator YafY